MGELARFRLELGLDVLDEWAATAAWYDKDRVYQALFAMVEGSLFRDYRVIDDHRARGELYVLVRDDLVLRLRIEGVGAFGILAIGRCGGRFAGRHTPTVA